MRSDPLGKICGIMRNNAENMRKICGKMRSFSKVNDLEKFHGRIFDRRPSKFSGVGGSTIFKNGTFELPILP